MKNIAVIGLGNVGSHLGDKLVESGFNVSEIVHRNSSEWSFYKNRWNCQIKSTPSEITSEIAFVCVQDRYIEEVVSFLPEKTIALITSGAFDPVGKFSGREIGVFYPLQTFTKNKEIIWNSIPILIESTSDDVLKQMKELARQMNVKGLECKTIQRQGYHLAAVWVNNFVNYILEQAQTLCEERKLDFNILEPLLYETVLKNLNSNGLSVQTGPAIRGDNATLTTHMNLLNEEQRAIYKGLTEFIQKKQKDA